MNPQGLAPGGFQDRCLTVRSSPPVLILSMRVRVVKQKEELEAIAISDHPSPFCEALFCPYRHNPPRLSTISFVNKVIISRKWLYSSRLTPRVTENFGVAGYRPGAILVI